MGEEIWQEDISGNMLKLPENVELILNKLKEYGSIGYVVGGCVRDTFLGREPNDWDITTPLLPEAVEKVFQDYKVIETGIKHGTVTVVIDDEPYEITTFRIDGTYSDGRHPDDVNFTDRLEDDLKRRDFTINAIAYNPDVGIIDLFNGLNDIDKGIIRCVGTPSDRFEEDALRILRALRFAITLGFKIENETLIQMRNKRNMLIDISKERICSELYKMMQTQFPNSFRILYECLELISYFIPNSNDDIKTMSFEYNQIIESLIATNKDDELSVRLALLYQYSDNLKDALVDIRMDNHTIKAVTDLLKHIDDYKHISYEKSKRKYEVRKLIGEIGFRNTKNLCDFWCAKIIGSISNINKFKYLEVVKQMRVDAGIIISNNDCCSLDKLDITGDDLISIGYKQGKEIGDVLNLLLDEVMHDPFKNKNRWLETWARELKDNQKNNTR